MKLQLISVACVTFVASIPSVPAQPAAPNYDEAKVPGFALPDPLVCADGSHVTSRELWAKKRRPALLRLFEEQVYGRLPALARGGLPFEVTSVVTNALSGQATRKEISIRLGASSNGTRLDLLLYLPNRARQPVPAFLGLNFNGNHAV